MKLNSINESEFLQKPGTHTPHDQLELIKYLEKETGLKFKSLGSTKDRESRNDIDIVEIPMSDEEANLANIEAQRYDQELYEKFEAGEISRDELLGEHP